MENAQQQLVEKLKSSTNILVTVSSNPTVDQLSACVGLTLWLNKLGKHATAVFSGTVPSTLEFLKPEETFEKNTDSLRDFIIALDKSKADKLRYKVEDKIVKIFITPYRTSLSADDLEFSQGDFNVDVVVTLGVIKQEDLDTAITAHGRILHDATVTSINVGDQQGVGSINWHEQQASSLSELAVDLGNQLDRNLLDSQIATALLTGIVAETARFSNEKTTPQTMNISAQLMGAGANQQLVASKLEEPAPAQATPATPIAASSEPSNNDASKSDDGTLEITHPSDTTDQPPAEAEKAPEPPTETSVSEESTPPSTNEPQTSPETDTPAGISNDHAPRIITEPPTLGGMLTANTQPVDDMAEPTTDPLSLPAVETAQPLLNRTDTFASNSSVPAPSSLPSLQPAPPAWTPPTPEPSEEQPETLTEIEESVHSPHLSGAPDVSAARDEVNRALSGMPPAPEARADLNAQPLSDGLHTDDTTPAPAQPNPNLTFDPTAFGLSPSGTTLPPAPASDSQASMPAPELVTPTEQPMTMPLPPTLSVPPANPTPPTSSNVTDPTAPPPVPPPMFPPAVS